jgi:hypothetical protein
MRAASSDKIDVARIIGGREDRLHAAVAALRDVTGYSRNDDASGAGHAQHVALEMEQVKNKPL